jgi:hypothetical protein
MRENRTYGSEGGEGKTLPDPYQYSAAKPSGHLRAPARHRGYWITRFRG